MLGVCKPGCRDGETPFGCWSAKRFCNRSPVVFPLWRSCTETLGACCRSQAQTPLPFQENELLPPQNMNAVEIESAVSDLAAQPFDAAEFPFAFLAAFGNKETTLKRLRTGNNNASDVPGGVLLRNNIHIAVCDAGAVGESLRTLRDSPATTKAKAKFVLATDGQTLEAEELRLR